MKHPDYDYDEIADNIFFPIYDRIAEQIIDATDVRNGKMLDIGCGILVLLLWKRQSLRDILQI